MQPRKMFQKFRTKVVHMQSTARTFRSKYEKEIKITDKKEHPAGPIVALKRGRPLLLESIDHMVQNYLKVSSNCILFGITFGLPTLISKLLKTVRVM